MSEDHLRLGFKCPECGPTVIELPDDHTDDSIAKCKSCGAELARYGDIKAKAIEIARDRVRGLGKDRFKG